jgi:hypothetical protein
MSNPESKTPDNQATTDSTASPAVPRAPAKPAEIGGREGLDPVRYGDWEKNGRCIDF